MITAGNSSLADANDLHQYFHLIEKYARPYAQLWHRKNWEYLFIAYQFKHWAAGRHDLECLGYGCGLERVPFILADQTEVACVTATDEPVAKACWENGQYASSKEQLLALARDLKLPVQEDKLYYEPADMNALTNRRADFIWSTSSLEHLGSMDHSIKFLVESSKLLKPNGLAAHATEYCFDETTILEGDSVFFLKEHLNILSDKLAINGLTLGPVDYRIGLHPYNNYIDKPPYLAHPSHLKLHFSDHLVTSIGLVIRRSNETT